MFNEWEREDFRSAEVREARDDSGMEVFCGGGGGEGHGCSWE
jgi:hypothetical protein